jgi:hypothetical protein
VVVHPKYHNQVLDFGVVVLFSWMLVALLLALAVPPFKVGIKRVLKVPEGLYVKVRVEDMLRGGFASSLSLSQASPARCALPSSYTEACSLGLDKRRALVAPRGAQGARVYTYPPATCMGFRGFTSTQ